MRTSRDKPAEQALMIFAKNANFVAEVLAEALKKQERDIPVAGWVVSILTERFQFIKKKLTEK